MVRQYYCELTDLILQIDIQQFTQFILLSSSNGLSVYNNLTDNVMSVIMKPTPSDDEK